MTDKNETSDNDFGYPTGKSVPFPYDTPYPQQVDLMDTMLRALKKKSEEKDEASVLLLESPTGTGKSLSLACAAMAWLRHVEKEDLDPPAASTTTTDECDSGVDWLDAWVSPEESHDAQVQQAVLQRAQDSRKSLDKELNGLRSKLVQPQSNRQRRENLVRSAVTSAKLMERKKLRKRARVQASSIKSTTKSGQEEQDFLVEDYRSDGEAQNDYDDSDVEESTSNKRQTDTVNLLDGSLLDGSRESQGTKHVVGSVQPGSGIRKIIYAARTHSQLSQFVAELRRTHWGDSVRVVALGGRQILCGNKDLRRKTGKSESAISEACLDLQKDSKAKCPLLASREAVSTLALHMLAQPCDIEDAARLGEASHTCAYYATRESLAAAEVVVLPYSMLLMQQTRQAVGLSLKESLVIVDEAHNLPEALRSLHSSRVSLPVAEAALAQLAAYTQKYSSRLAGRNLYYLGCIRRCLLAFVEHLKSEPNANEKMISPAELLINLKLDNINIFKLLSYLKKSRLPQKLLGFTSAQSNPSAVEDHDGQTMSKHVSSLSIVQSFLEKLTSTGREGKIVTDWPSSQSKRSTQHPTLRYVLLHPSAQFQNVVDEAHAVALVGGTLRPFAHVAAELLGTKHVEQAAKADSLMRQRTTSCSTSSVTSSLTAFACDHVVPAHNVRLECLSVGPSNHKLDFRHQSRMTNAVCDEMGRALEAICKVVPCGIVVFLPSYSYEAHLVRRWKATGLLQNLKRLKKVHREPKSSQQVEMALEAYSRDAESGALLFSVVGGKMSEGINFANNMARCVMVVGLPYPDITDQELKEKMSSMDAAAARNKSSISGQAYYQNLCMRAVNQSVGRAIRHASDYAAIVLADFRYSTDSRISSGLPQWLRRGGVLGGGNKSFGGAMKRLTTFFEETTKRQQKSTVVSPGK